MKKQLLSFILIYFVLTPILILGGLYTILKVTEMGVQKQMIHECLVWERYSKEYNGYYLLKWQKAQCDDMGIIINAPVK